MEKKDGGPAFPQTVDDMGTPCSKMQVVSLRDYFAAESDLGDASDWSKDFIAKIIGIPVTSDYDVLESAERLAKAQARIRYIIADAMIAEREKA